MTIDMQRIDRIIGSSGIAVSETTREMIQDIGWQFDIYDEIQAALAGEESKLSEEIAEALSYTQSDPPIGMLDSDYDR